MEVTKGADLFSRISGENRKGKLHTKLDKKKATSKHSSGKLIANREGKHGKAVLPTREANRKPRKKTFREGFAGPKGGDSKGVWGNLQGKKVCRPWGKTTGPSWQGSEKSEEKKITGEALDWGLRSQHPKWWDLQGKETKGGIH